MAGAQFVVSPTVNPGMIRMAQRYGIPCISGALTPTEILTAYESGADMVKVFPANVMGPGYIKSVHGPLPHIPLMATGGIDKDNMLEYFQGGVQAVGVGSQLVDAKRLSSQADLENVTNIAKQYIEKVSEVES
nr:bifunctional 4-hydroxy-2-oxoglutarate aldolase/2-dehydro-3-deoxy-phosphogluconate aldolase [Halobacillus shinanisalinarum]